MLLLIPRIGPVGQPLHLVDFDRDHAEIIYQFAAEAVELAIGEHIEEFSKHYGDEDQFHADVVFNILYAAMVAEQKKEHTKLKKRVKRLGVHQLLMENYTPSNAATFSRGKRWRDLEVECNRRGF